MLFAQKKDVGLIERQDRPGGNVRELGARPIVDVESCPKAERLNYTAR